MKQLLVHTSSIEGKGVFAQEDIKQSELITIIDDSHIIEDSSTLSEEKKDHLDYLDGKYVLMQSPEVYINHSCDPNCYVKTINHERHIIALRDIAPGEEIVYDYAINGDYDRGASCHCGSTHCRGKLDNNFWHLPLTRQLEYLPYLDDWFIEKYKQDYENLTKVHNQ